MYHPNQVNIFWFDFSFSLIFLKLNFLVSISIYFTNASIPPKTDQYILSTNIYKLYQDSIDSIVVRTRLFTNLTKVWPFSLFSLFTHQLLSRLFSLSLHLHTHHLSISSLNLFFYFLLNCEFLVWFFCYLFYWKYMIKYFCCVCLVLGIRVLRKCEKTKGNRFYFLWSIWFPRN